MIDYKVNSSKVGGAKCPGTLYIRGAKENGWDNFKFILEKENDFNDFDAKIIVKAYEQAFKPGKGLVFAAQPSSYQQPQHQQPAHVSDPNLSAAMKKF